MTRRSLRSATAIATAALGLLLGAAAGADQGTATLESKSDGQVLMNGNPYRVTESTVLESKEGNRLSFQELPTIAEGASADDAAVWFESSDGDSMQTLHRLKLTGAQPD